MDRQPTPGIGRAERIGTEGLQRLEAQLASGARPSALILRQWIARYGAPAEALLRRHGLLPPDGDGSDR